MSDPFKTQGGKRPGAGRKPGDGQAEPTAVMRVPVSQAGTIRDFIAALQNRRRHEAQDNVIELTRFAPDGRSRALPLYTTRVAAGFPSPADDHVEKRLSPSDYLVQNDSATFFVRVKGDSMIDAGIFENDVLVVDRSIDARVGDIVLAILDGEFTVKTLGRSKQGPRLMPANRNFPVIEIREGQTFEVCGVVTGSMRKFK
ncbi:LexA repressor [mine drainage metagenome]|uniref:LexA repressor n=1 Tax=mine drainage metagenome TaxID=410659 RepID=A0A1J5R2B2_9ZZZZ